MRTRVSVLMNKVSLVLALLTTVVCWRLVFPTCETCIRMKKSLPTGIGFNTSSL